MFFSLTFINAASYNYNIIELNAVWHPCSCFKPTTLTTMRHISKNKNLLLKIERKTNEKRNTDTKERDRDTERNKMKTRPSRTTAFLLLTHHTAHNMLFSVCCLAGLWFDFIFHSRLCVVFFISVENGAELHHSLIVCRTRFKPLD